MNRVVHFEVQADDVARAMKFYEDVFDWRFEQWGDEGYWMVITAERNTKEPGINGGMYARPVAEGESGVDLMNNAYVCTVEVESFDEIAEKIENSGGIIAMPKFAIPGMAWQGYFIDPEGNTFGVHQPDEGAQ